MSTAMTCAMCGTVYDPAGSSGCASCPLGAHCSLACCPACGYSTVDVGRSRLARLATRVAAGRKRRLAAGQTLAGAPTGARVLIDRVVGLTAWQERQLVGYGVAPGREAEVVQLFPVVVVRVDNVELAFERRVAEGIRIADTASRDTPEAALPSTAAGTPEA